MDDITDSTLAPDHRRALRGAPSPRAQLYVVFFCDHPRRPTSRHSLHDVDTVLIGRGEAGWMRTTDLPERPPERQLVLRLPDRWMSSAHVRLHRTMGRWLLEDCDSKNGTIVGGVQVARGARVALSDGDLIEAGHTFLLFREAVETAPDDPFDVDTSRLTPVAAGLSTLSPPLAREFERLAAAARSKEEVVLFGESGTGKEVIARAVHRLSGREGEFVPVNCGAIPETLVESELFGYKKGAHSEAKQDTAGLVRTADGGTLFLDEIGDLPLASQVKFLRVLQEREVRPVGAVKPVSVDIRLIAATHQDLTRLAAEGRFRDDLRARIGGFTITMPPLRERREDFGLITAELLRNVEGSEDVRFTTDAVRALLRYKWPLNIRELEKGVRTAVVLARSHGGSVEVEDLPREVQLALSQPDDPEDEPIDERRLSEEDKRRREQLIALLTEQNGNISAVARQMNKARMQVQRWLKRYRLDAEQYRRL